MQNPFKDTRSPLFSTLKGICSLGLRLSLMDQARKVFGKYMGIEVSVFISLLFHVAMIWILPYVGKLISIIILVISCYRIITMAISHMAILLLQTGKSTEGERVHSRLRYLALTFLNLAEVVMFGAIVILVVKNLTEKQIFTSDFASRAAILYHCFKLTMLNITVTPQPISLFGYFLHVSLSLLGMELIVVVLAVVLTIRSEDEAFLYRELSNEEYWNWRARFFERSPWANEPIFMRKIVEPLVKRNSSKVLDVGCGSGILSRELSAHGLQITGIDNSEAMLKIAMKYSPKTIRYILGSADCLPVPDNSYDAVVMRMVLHNVSEWRLAISHAFRVLKKGGGRDYSRRLSSL